MFDKILHMLEGKKKPSYQDRLQSIDEFFRKYDLYKEMWPEQPREPLSIVWAVSTNYPEIFMQQLGSMVQFDGLFSQEDQIVFVADIERKADVAASKFITGGLDTKGVTIRASPRGWPGPKLGVSMDYIKRPCSLIRDLGLFFNP
jgi:hypothetical protein